MEPIKLYPKYEEAAFVERDNRFVMTLRKKNNDIIKAYIANPGRLEEFLTPDHPFYMTPGNNGKYYYHVVSTFYQGAYILLDTIKINRVIEELLRRNRIPEFTDYTSFRREYTVERSKFDFLLEQEGKPPALLEIKSCSLCHNGVAMFPDAPTTRGKRHLEDLDKLATKGYDTFNLYLINHPGARVFSPNGHTDPDYCRSFVEASKVRSLAYTITMQDPVTVDPNHLEAVPIDKEKAREMSADRGSYLLVFSNDKEFSEAIGSLGKREFKKGYYVYVGSAMQGLESRISRHLRKTKKKHWHLDYLSPTLLKKEKAYRIRRAERIEEAMARALLEISDGYVPGFGASDTNAPSHLFYFTSRPHRRREFLDILLGFQLF